MIVFVKVKHKSDFSFLLCAVWNLNEYLSAFLPKVRKDKNDTTLNVCVLLRLPGVSA